jgi:hypothetical protein
LLSPPITPEGLKVIFQKKFLFWSLKLTVKEEEVPAAVATLPPLKAAVLVRGAARAAVAAQLLLGAAVPVGEAAPALAVVAGAVSSVYCK